MGILSSLKNIGSGIASDLRTIVGTNASQKIASGANKALTVLTSPIQSITNWNKAQKETAQKGAIRLAGEGALNTLTVLAPLTSSGKTAATKVVTSLIPKSTVGKIGGTVAAVLGTGVIVGSQKARETVVFEGGKAIPSMFNVGKNVGKLIDSPSLESAKNIFKENPIASTVLGGSIVAAGGWGAANTVATFMNTQVTKENTKVMTEEMGTGVIPETPNDLTLPKDKYIPTDDTRPITAPTETITTGTTKRRKYAPRKPSKPSSINIRIDNRDNYTERKLYKPRGARK